MNYDGAFFQELWTANDDEDEDEDEDEDGDYCRAAVALIGPSRLQSHHTVE